MTLDQGANVVMLLANIFKQLKRIADALDKKGEAKMKENCSQDELRDARGVDAL